MHVSLAKRSRCQRPSAAAFSLTDLLVVIAVLSVLAACAIATTTRIGAKTKLTQCLSNLRQVNQAVLKFTAENRETLPAMEGSPAPGGWWWYKELVKSHAGLTGESSANDLVFACPEDRGYDNAPGGAKPFCRSARHDFTSYVFNGVNLPGIPNVANRKLASIQAPARTLLVMEWTAHAPLSWHRSRTGHANSPFYNDAESVVAFVDGHAALVKIHYDGLNAAFTRDPVSGYDYKYSGD